MCRKSLTNVTRAISAIAPAISTPVGPPPTTTKVIAASRTAWSRFFRDLEGDQHAAADFQRVVEILQARRKFLPFSMPEIRMSRAGGDDQIIVGDRSVRRDDFSSAIDARASPRITSQFSCLRRMCRSGSAISAGESAAVAT